MADKEDNLPYLVFTCEALHNFKAERKHELSFQEGESLTVTGISKSGWWEAENANGDTGLVPRTFLKVPDHIKSIINGDMESITEKKNTASTDSKTPLAMVFICECLYDFEAQQNHDLSFHEGESLTVTGVCKSGWWKAQNAKGDTGLVPCTFLKVPEHIKSIINGDLESLTEKRNTSSTDSKSVLGMFKRSTKGNEDTSRGLMDEGSLPEGFRPSVLFDHVKKNNLYSLGNFMTPKLDDSGISFKDICYEKTLLKPNATLLQKKIRVIAARQITEPPDDFAIKSRHIRMCFHDGNKVLSNIHSVKAKWKQSAPKDWMFTSKITSKDSCIEEGEIFIKCSECVPTLGILFELCISYENVNGISGEMCSGWAFMKLLDDTGKPIKSKLDILKVQDTEPFTASFLPATSQSPAHFYKKMKEKQKMKRIVIVISNPDRASNQQISYLPSCLVGPWSSIPILCLFRKITAEDLLERSSFDSTERILSPLLASMPNVLSAPVLLDILRISWPSILKGLNTDNMRTENTKKKAIQDLFCKTVFALSNSYNLTSLFSENSESENARKIEIDRLLHVLDDQEETLSLSEKIEFSPLSLNMISANIINLNKCL